MPNWIVHGVLGVALTAGILLFDRQARSKKGFLQIFGIIFSANLIDIDHLLADPIYDPARCSIGFHPLHSWYMYPVYGLLLLFRNKWVTYWVVGVFVHLVADGIDCVW